MFVIEDGVLTFDLTENIQTWCGQLKLLVRIDVIIIFIEVVERKKKHLWGLQCQLWQWKQICSPLAVDKIKCLYTSVWTANTHTHTHSAPELTWRLRDLKQTVLSDCRWLQSQYRIIPRSTNASDSIYFLYSPWLSELFPPHPTCSPLKGSFFIIVCEDDGQLPRQRHTTVLGFKGSDNMPASHGCSPLKPRSGVLDIKTIPGKYRGCEASSSLSQWTEACLEYLQLSHSQFKVYLSWILIHWSPLCSTVMSRIHLDRCESPCDRQVCLQIV